MLRRTALTGMVCAMLLSVAGVAHAVPNFLQYQGRLTDAAGNPQNGNFSIQFAVYSVATGGSALWTETQANVAVANGLFNVILGTVTPLPANLFSGADRYLGIKVGSDPEMTPRQRVTSVGYALRAGFVDQGPGASFHENPSNFYTIPNSGALVGIDTVTITIPTDGYIMVEAGCEAYYNHSTGTFSYCRFQVNDAFALTAFGPGSDQFFVSAPLPTASYDNTIICKRLFQKAAGTYSFFFLTQFISGAGSYQVQMQWASATFFPTLYGTVSVASDDQPTMNVGPSPLVNH